MADIGKFFGSLFGSAAGAANPLTPAEGIITGATYSGDTKSGEQKGKYEFIGGAPIKV